MGAIKKWLESSGMAAIVFMGGIGFVLALVLSAFFTSGASSPVSEDVEGAYKTGSYTATTLRELLLPARPESWVTALSWLRQSVLTSSISIRSSFIRQYSRRPAC